MICDLNIASPAYRRQTIPEIGVVMSRHMTHFKFLVPLRYLQNGLS